MQITDSDFTQNDWRRRLGGGGNDVLYSVHSLRPCCFVELMDPWQFIL